LAPALGKTIGRTIASRRLYEVLEGINFDILHVHAIHNSYWNHGVLAGLSPRIPTVWTFHDFWGFSPESYRFQTLEGGWLRLKPDGEDREAAMQRRLRYFGSRQNLRLVGNSVATATLAQRALGRPVEAIQYGLPLDQYRPVPRDSARLSLGISSGAFVLGFSADATSDPIKGFKVLESALLRLDCADAHAIAVGSGQCRDYTIGSTRVHALGRVDNPRLQSIVYSACDAYVVPSLAEALGQVAMESVSCGTPVFAARTGGLVDVVVPERTGWLFEPGNGEDLLAKIVTLVRNPKLSRDMHVGCRTFAESHWSMERQAQDYLRLYENLLSVSPHA
jgi:glycosyltransferase involved in cell wall biosynthesis